MASRCAHRTASTFRLLHFFYSRKSRIIIINKYIIIIQVYCYDVIVGIPTMLSLTGRYRQNSHINNSTVNDCFKFNKNRSEDSSSFPAAVISQFKQLPNCLANNGRARTNYNGNTRSHKIQ